MREFLDLAQGDQLVFQSFQCSDHALESVSGKVVFGNSAVVLLLWPVMNVPAAVFVDSGAFVEYGLAVYVRIVDIVIFKQGTTSAGNVVFFSRTLIAIFPRVTAVRP